MSVSLGCRELKMDCPFVAEGESEKAVLDSFMSHVQTEHTEDWFEIEEVYRAAIAILHEKAA